VLDHAGFLVVGFLNQETVVGNRFWWCRRLALRMQRPRKQEKRYKQ